MLAALAAISLFAPAEAYELTPTDDVWVYPHASDPARDPYLRVWGNGSSSVEKPGLPPEEHSYGYLRFDLSPLPKRFKLREATLFVWHTPNPGWDSAVTKASPLEVRGMQGDFAERTWRFEDTAKAFPDPEKAALFGSSAPEPGGEGKELRIGIELMGPGSKLETVLTKALEAEHPFLALALCSKLDPSEVGQGAIYRLFSKDGPKEFRPQLRIVLERTP